ncbi:hypothetical protein G3T14_11250 [Methylobacterium sp. BTF04]|uniref:ribbon-helix-helix domain-containing protein n=1 Tax=Methylobacterium sp. BTF04 TaxID=2708300 RepID=UPI0013D098D8|nr:CopG family transcriptional regulator [Methylobacterium sp. BTF04]NEU12711.1 hypothetical protein [Methylobacterium sp. BTF04]
MPAVQTLTLTLDPDLAIRFAEAVERTGLSSADLVSRALRNDLDGIVAYGRMYDEINLVKDRLATLASLIGEVLAEPAQSEMAAICRYKAPISSSTP